MERVEKLKKYALISVSDKRSLADLGNALSHAGYTILATGNSARILKASAVACTEISDFTGFPEVFDGRVKTLNPLVFGGILMRRDNQEDLAHAEKLSVSPIDVVVVNLYPFEQVATNQDAELADLIENIDIGGPSLIRAAAKNHQFVSVLTSPDQYTDFMERLTKADFDIAYRRKLALDAFLYTSRYDAAIAQTLPGKFGIASHSIRIAFDEATHLRYGENPHQSAALFGKFSEYYEALHGKELSYNNILDLIAAVSITEETGPNSCAIIKHNNPCGAAVASSNLLAYEKALACDPVSAFGGIVSLNGTVDADLAAKLNEIFLEVVIAESFTDEAMALLRKKKDRRIVRKLKPFLEKGFQFRTVPGGFIAQEADISSDFDNLRVVTAIAHDPSRDAEIRFAWTICKHTKSNAIVLVKDGAAVGIGAGQVSRIDSARIAVAKAKERGFDLSGSVAASDAFFPFEDGVVELAEAGITIVIQPGGSVRDAEVIAAADRTGISMIFTGIRHFKH